MVKVCLAVCFAGLVFRNETIVVGSSREEVAQMRTNGDGRAARADVGIGDRRAQARIRRAVGAAELKMVRRIFASRVDPSPKFSTI